MVLRLKWSFKKYISTLTLARLIILGVTLWALGLIFWIIPVTYERVSQLRTQNEQLSHYLVRVKQKTVNIKQNSISVKSELANIQLYKEVFIYVKETNTILLEYQEISHKDYNTYQFSVTGSWLDTRLLLEKVRTNNGGYIIDSIDFQRNRKDNSVNMTVLLQGKKL